MNAKLNHLRHGAFRYSWVAVGAVSTFLSAVAGLIAFLWWGPTPLIFVAVPAACLVCQAVAVAAVVLPGPASRTEQLAECYEGWTVGLVCGSWIFGVFPAGAILAFQDPNGRPVAAVFVAGASLMLPSVAGLITVTALSGRTGGEGDGLTGDAGFVDMGDA